MLFLFLHVVVPHCTSWRYEARQAKRLQVWQGASASLLKYTKPSGREQLGRIKIRQRISRLTAINSDPPPLYNERNTGLFGRTFLRWSCLIVANDRLLFSPTPFATSRPHENYLFNKSKIWNGRPSVRPLRRRIIKEGSFYPIEQLIDNPNFIINVFKIHSDAVVSAGQWESVRVRRVEREREELAGAQQSRYRRSINQS